MHSESNGQVERFHSTLLEIARCVRVQQSIDDMVDLLLLSTGKYNNSVHSVTGRKPIDVLYALRQDIVDDVKRKLQGAQEKTLKTVNAEAFIKTYEPGTRVFVRRNRRLGNKFDKWYVEGVVEKDLGSTVLIDGKRVHKNNLR